MFSRYNRIKKVSTNPSYIFFGILFKLLQILIYSLLLLTYIVSVYFMFVEFNILFLSNDINHYNSNINKNHSIYFDILNLNLLLNCCALFGIILVQFVCIPYVMVPLF
jgi:hypothetical protein